MDVNDRPLRFLVVDDDDDVRDVFVRMIEHLGHDAAWACDGVEAIAAVAVHPYDFMLLDLAMPRMPGEDVMRWLKDHPQWTAELRVVVVTGLAGVHRRRLEALGAHAVLAKPLRPQQLLDLISRTQRDERERRTPS